MNFTAPVALYLCSGYYALAQSQQRPLAPVLLAVGGIGGTALDQRQQYTACHTLKKVLAPPLSLRGENVMVFRRNWMNSAVLLPHTCPPRPAALHKWQQAPLLPATTRCHGTFIERLSAAVDLQPL